MSHSVKKAKQGVDHGQAMASSDLLLLSIPQPRALLCRDVGICSQVTPAVPKGRQTLVLGEGSLLVLLPPDSFQPEGPKAHSGPF